MNSSNDRPAYLSKSDFKIARSCPTKLYYKKLRYFHPEMKGSLSIKYILPAIWRNNSALRETLWFRKYAATQNGVILNPYATLPSLPIGSDDELVNEGTGAMRAYQAMLYGDESANFANKENWKRLLLQYCELDTMAMVVIFEHWCREFDFHVAARLFELVSRAGL